MSKKSRRGRPTGAKTRHTAKGLDPLENTLRAHWGLNHSSLGGFIGHQAWINRNPSKLTLAKNAEMLGIAPAELLARIKREPLAEYVTGAIISALDGRDAQFFEDIAATLRRIKADGSIIAAEPQESALLKYFEVKRGEEPTCKFTRMELQRDVAWPKDEKGRAIRPSTTKLARMIDKFQIPMRRGPSPGK